MEFLLASKKVAEEKLPPSLPPAVSIKPSSSSPSLLSQWTPPRNATRRAAMDDSRYVPSPEEVEAALEEQLIDATAELADAREQLRATAAARDAAVERLGTEIRRERLSSKEITPTAESGNVDALKRELRSVRLDASEVDHALSVWSHVDH